MAGGGGTRLWPLSRPERPKPFLPLLGDETLLQATVRRLSTARGRRRARATCIAVVTDRRYEPLVREQLAGRPDSSSSRRAATPPPRSRSRRVADRPPRRRGHGRAARGPPDRPDREGVFREVLADGRRPASRRARSGSTTPLVTLGDPADPPGDRVRLPVPRLEARRATSTGLRAYPLARVRGEAASPPAREELFESGGRRLERRDVPVAAAARSARRSSATRGARRPARADDPRQAAAGARVRPDQAACRSTTP